MYGCESWAVKKTNEDHITAFDMKGLWLIVRIKWAEKMTSKLVLEKT
jgi:hypothetical protein